MAESIHRKIERSLEEVARLRDVRERYQRDRPSITDLEAQGAEFTTLGEVIFLRSLADDLKQERERQGLSCEQLAFRVHMTPESLANIEAGTVGTSTLGILSRIAHALGKQITYSIVEKVA